MANDQPTPPFLNLRNEVESAPGWPLHGHWQFLALLLCWIARLPLSAAVLTEDFSTDPAQHGWGVFGDNSLFHWNASNGNLEATWDSSRTNSYYFHRLGTVLANDDDFSLAFDLRMSDMAVGTTAGKPFTFEIAVGLLDYRSATNANFFRGSGNSATYHPRNLVEFDYFPDSGYGATFSPTVAFTNPPTPVYSQPLIFSDNHPLAVTIGDTFRITLTHTASNRTLRTVVTRNGQPFGLPPDNAIKDLALSNFMDFRADTVAVCSYSDDHAGGSILAHGVVDNLVVVTPAPPITSVTGHLAGPLWQVQFDSRTNWSYFLERTTNWAWWNTISTQAAGTGLPLVLPETNSASAASAFYRVRAERP